MFSLSQAAHKDEAVVVATSNSTSVTQASRDRSSTEQHDNDDISSMVMFLEIY